MAKAKQAQPASVAVAVLKDAHIGGVLYAAGTVLVLPADLAEAHSLDGDVDPHPAAVEHLRSVGAREFQVKS